MRLVLIGLVLGCGGGDGGDKAISIDSDVTNVCDEIAEVTCHNMYQCCAEGEIEDLLGVSDPRSEDECRQDVRRRCARAIAPRELGIAEARLRFEPRIMNACLEALIAPEDTCAAIVSALPWSDACAETAWVGLVPNGGKCLSMSECSSKDSICNAAETCVALPVDGEPCGTSGCAPSAFCDVDTCRSRAPAGTACGSTMECLDDLFCQTDSILPVCTMRHGVGQSCTGPETCASGRCNPGTCDGSTQTCFADSECAGRCEDDDSPCLDDDACASPAVCVRACVGGSVCADTHVVADYCEGAINGLPILVVEPSRSSP